MVSPTDPRLRGVPPEVAQDLIGFGHRIAQEITGGRGRLNEEDPDALSKLFNAVDDSAKQMERQTGVPRENQLQELLERVNPAIAARGQIPRPQTGPSTVVPQIAERRAEITPQPGQGEGGLPLAFRNAFAGAENVSAPVVAGATELISLLPGPLLDEQARQQRALSEQRRQQADRLGLRGADRIAFISGQNLVEDVRAVERPPGFTGAVEVIADPINIVPLGAASRTVRQGVRQGAGQVASGAGSAVRRAAQAVPDAQAVRRFADDALPIGTAQALDEGQREALRARIVADMTAGRVSDEFSFHVSDNIEGVIQEGLRRGGLAGSPLQEQGFGRIVHVFRNSDLPPNREALGADISFGRGFDPQNPPKPIASFTFDELGVDINELRLGARAQELGFEGEPPLEMLASPEQIAATRLREAQEAQRLRQRIANAESPRAQALDEGVDEGLSPLAQEARVRAREREIAQARQSAATPPPPNDGVKQAALDELEVEIAQARSSSDPAAIQAAHAKAQRFTQESAERSRTHVETGSPDGGNVPPPPNGAPVDDADQTLRDAMLARLQGTGRKASSLERVDQALLRQHEAKINIAQRAARDVVNQGNERLLKLGIGRKFRGTVVPKDDAEKGLFDELLFKPLHGEAPDAPATKAIIDDLREHTGLDTAQKIDFDPEMALVDDYFYRGWKVADGHPQDALGRLVYTPGFKKPRVNATYSEMRELGYEPLFWNPYEQWYVSRMMGVRYRAQMQLVDALKQMGDDFILPNTGGKIRKGWRVPKIGPAFEGKSVLVKAENGEVIPGAVRRYIVPNKIANSLEGLYGKKPELGTISVGSKEIDLQKAVDWAVFVPKRAKLTGSFFQQIDFAGRAGFATAANFLDLMSRGRPDLALRAGFAYPKTIVDMMRANFSPGYRRRLRRELTSEESILPGRNVSMAGIMRQNLNMRDNTLIPADVDQIAREAVTGAGLLGNRAVREAIGSLERASRNGLFEGVYPAAIKRTVRLNIAPMMERMYPHLDDVQLEARIAAVANRYFSTLPETMSVVQNRFVRETLRRVFFSLNENEGLLSQAVKTFTGADKRFWATNWLGAYLFLITTANVIHFASTGQPLPAKRYTPLTLRGYNTKFASPDLPFNAGRNSLPVTVDLVGQMDTAFRVLDPRDFIESRLSVPVSAGANQWAGEDFFGNKIDQVGPGGVVSRTVAAANDLFGPIGLGPVTNRMITEAFPNASRIVPRGETTLGVGGLTVQGAGLNLRAYKWAELEEMKQEQPRLRRQIDKELDQRRIDFALQNITDERNISTTTNALRARLRDARNIGYREAIPILEAELKRRGESTTTGPVKLFR